MSLTIVVPTIPGRESLLSRCLWSITSQPGDCRVLVMAGVGKLGDKVNRAAELVETSHMTIVDDDDYVIPPYVSAVSEKLLESDPDYVGLRLLVTRDEQFAQIDETRGDAREWMPFRKGPVPKGVTRTTIWRDTPMGNHYTADREWMASVALKVRTHEFVDRVVYVHDWRPARSSFTGTKPTPLFVGQWPYDKTRIEVACA